MKALDKISSKETTVKIFAWSEELYCWVRLLSTAALARSQRELQLQRPSLSLHIDVFGPTDQTSLF